MNVTALIAEDEGAQRRALSRLLAVTWPECQIVAECADGTSAVAAMQAQQPTVAFLDIRMAGSNGLEVAQRAGTATQIVFTTAYDQHAVRAFELGAVDYILKPVTAERLAEATRRLRWRLRVMADSAAVGSQDTQSATLPAKLTWITATTGNTVKLIAVRNVLFFQASDSCTRVVHDAGEAIIRTPLYELLQSLDPDVFWQIHRSVIVQVGAIKAVRRNELGRLEIAMHGSDQTLPVSQSFHYRFRAM